MFQLFDQEAAEAATWLDASHALESLTKPAPGAALHQRPVLQGQNKVLECWLALARGRRWACRAQLDLSAFPRELAHLSLLALAPNGAQFRLAGGGLKQRFGREARGVLATDIPECRTSAAWTSGVEQALNDLVPVYGETRLADGGVHFWLRLPVSSDGSGADLVLCHDRYLPAEALGNPDLAARAADEALQRELFEAA